MSEPTPYDAQREAAAWLAAVVDNSSDAIVSKTLDGIITSWNGGAENLFGFSAEKAIDQPITIIIPGDRLHEEPEIIVKLRVSERVDRFETIRCRKVPRYHSAPSTGSGAARERGGLPTKARR